MKKGLLSFLAGSLLIVGCQNYDDQFSNLESQINALASTVAGLSQVQSDLSSLAGTVSSLQSSVSSLGATIDASVASGISGLATAAELAALQTKVEDLSALSTGLAALQTTVDALTASLADVASSSEVDAIKAALALAQADLDELLANGSVHTGEIKISDTATLDAFYAMGSGIAIVNGNVDIDVTTDMDIVKVQSVVDKILTTTKQFEYHAASKTVKGVTFNNLTGTQTLTIKQADGYELKSLESATVVTLDDEWSTEVDIIHLGKLATVNSIGQGTAEQGTLQFSKAAEIHLSSLTYYKGGDLTLKGMKGGVIDISKLTDTNPTTGLVAPFDLSITGPKEMTITKIAGDSEGSDTGALSFTDVATVHVTNFGGATTLSTGVDVATLEDVATEPVISGATDLTTLSIEGVTGYGQSHNDDTATTKAATLYTENFITVSLGSAHKDLTSATITGNVKTVTVNGASNLETLTLDKLNAATVTVQSNEDLTTLTTGEAKIKSLTIKSNSGLTSAALDYDTYTLVKKTAVAGDDYGILDVNNNTNLASLTVHVKSLNSLTLDTNAKLETVSFPFLAAAKIGLNPVLVIKKNKFTATSVTDKYDEKSDGTPITLSTANDTTNTGSYTSTSGLKSLTTWIDAAIAAKGKNTLEVWFDIVDTVITMAKNGTSTSAAGITMGSGDYTSSNASKVNAAVYVVPKVDKVSNFAGAAAGQVITYAFDLVHEGIAQTVKALGSGEGFVVTASNGDTVTFAQSAATGSVRTTVKDLVDYMNADTSLNADGIELEAQLDSAMGYVYTISYLQTTNSLNSAGTVSGAGNIFATFKDLAGNDKHLSAAVSAGDRDIEIAEEFRADIHALADYTAVSITAGANAYKSFVVYANVSGTATRDKSPLMAATPKLDIHPLSTTTTAVLGNNVAGFRTASYLSNTFSSNAGTFSLADATGVAQPGLRVTLRDTTGLGFNSTVTLTAASTANSNTSIKVGANANELTPNLLVDGVSIVSAANNTSTSATDKTATTYWVSSGAAVGTEVITVAAQTAITTDRTSWL